MSGCGLGYAHEAHEWSEPGPEGMPGVMRCDGRADPQPNKAAGWAEITYERKMQSQALHTIYAALGGLQIYGPFEDCGTVMDDTSSVRQVLRHIEPDGKQYAYTTNVTVSVSRVELK